MSLPDAVDTGIVRAALPATWTHVHNINWLAVGFALKIAGINWKSIEDGMATVERMGLVQRNGHTIRRTP